MAKPKAQRKYTWEFQGTKCIKRWTIGPPQVFDLKDLPGEPGTDMCLQYTRHGVKQKLDDCHTGESDIAVCRAASQAVWEASVGGEWSRRGEGVSSLIPTYERLVEAFAAVSADKGITVDDAKAILHQQGCRPVDESEIKDAKERAKENRKATAARKAVAAIPEIAKWITDNTERVGPTLEELLASKAKPTTKK